MPALSLPTSDLIHIKTGNGRFRAVRESSLLVSRVVECRIGFLIIFCVSHTVLHTFIVSKRSNA